MPIKFSVEFFPPAPELTGEVCMLIKQYVKSFPIERISITHGASGSSKDKSLNFIQAILERRVINAEKITAHLSCAGLEREEVLGYVEKFYSLGVREILVIKGDGGDKTPKNPFPSTAEAILEIKKQFPSVKIVAACFPEPRQGVADEMVVLKEKIAGGADKFISQFCFENHLYEQFYKNLKENNIQNEITIGLIVPSKQTLSFAEKCWAKIPPYVHEIAKNENNAVKYVVNQLKFLESIGCRSVHLYSLNKLAFMMVMEEYLSEL